MKPVMRLSLGIVACSLVFPLYLLAQDSQKEVAPTDPSRAQRLPRSVVDRLQQEFDQDGDGRLDTAEREAARRSAEQFTARFQDARTKRRPPGDGAGVPAGADAHANRAQPVNQAEAVGGKVGSSIEELIQRFDRDSDGRLNDSEWAEMRQAADSLRRDPVTASRGSAPTDSAKSGLARPEMRPPGANRRPDGPPNAAAVIQRFDRDGDGRLNADEQQAARAEMAKRFSPGGPGAGGPGGGLLPGTGTAPQPKLDLQPLLKQFDKDGDGRLSDDERSAARAEFLQRRQAKPTN